MCRRSGLRAMRRRWSSVACRRRPAAVAAPVPETTLRASARTSSAAGRRRPVAVATRVLETTPRTSARTN
eukprot:12335011-Alexandrium_andersonii.AAC.1